MMDIMVQESEQKGLILNIAKSYTMVNSKSSSIPTCQIKVHVKLMEQVNSFVYLGTVFTSDGRCEKEVKRRIGTAKTAFTSILLVSVYSPFSDRAGLPLHNIHIPSLFTAIMDIFFVDLKFDHIRFYTL